MCRGTQRDGRGGTGIVAGMAKRSVFEEVGERRAAPVAAAGRAPARGVAAGGGRVAVLCGPERAGLANEDVVLADAIVSVPVNPAFASLNLAQCVLLTAYEWRRTATDDGAVPAEMPERAASGDVGRLLDHLTGELEAAGFFFPEHKRAAMLANLHNLFRRAPLTDQDVRTLWGVVRALAGGPKRRQ